jgi:hypothetical protein
VDITDMNKIPDIQELVSLIAKPSPHANILSYETLRRASLV